MLEKNENYIKFKEYYSKKTVFDEVGMFRFEDVHTNFLSNLLKSDNIYGLKNRSMELFLEVCGVNKLTNISDVKLLVRKNIGSEKYKPDMVFEFKSEGLDKILVIENKVYANENRYNINGNNIGQCKLYKDLLSDEYKGTEIIFVYLHYKVEDYKKNKSNGYVYINYKCLLNEFLDVIVKDVKNSYKYILEEYINSFKSFYIPRDVSYYKSIPVSSEGMELTKKLDCNLHEIKDEYLKFIYSINKYNINYDDEYLSELYMKNQFVYNGSNSTMTKIMLNIINVLDSKNLDLSKLKYKEYNILEDKNVKNFYNKVNGTKNLNKKLYLASWYFDEFADFLVNVLPLEFKNYFEVNISYKKIEVKEIEVNV